VCLVSSRFSESRRCSSSERCRCRCASTCRQSPHQRRWWGMSPAQMSDVARRCCAILGTCCWRSATSASSPACTTATVSSWRCTCPTSRTSRDLNTYTPHHLVLATHPVWARERCRISPPCFLAECHLRRLNQASFVLLYFALFAFYPRDAMLARVIEIATCLSVRLSVTRRYCVKTKKLAAWFLHHLVAPTL